MDLSQNYSQSIMYIIMFVYTSDERALQNHNIDCLTSDKRETWMQWLLKEIETVDGGPKLSQVELKSNPNPNTMHVV